VDRWVSLGQRCESLTVITFNCSNLYYEVKRCRKSVLCGNSPSRFTVRFCYRPIPGRHRLQNVKGLILMLPTPAWSSPNICSACRRTDHPSLYIIVCSLEMWPSLSLLAKLWTPKVCFKRLQIYKKLIHMKHIVT
jgi:hypothetical protein